MGKKKLKVTDLSQKGLGFPTEHHITDFYGLNVKNYGPKNPSYHFGSQMGPFELEKLKTPRQYWFHINDLVKRFNIDMLSRDENEEEF